MRRLVCRWFGHHTIVFSSPLGTGAACLRCYDIHYRHKEGDR